MTTATLRSLSDYHNPIEVPVRIAPMPHHVAGLMWTASGYGARIPTRYMVQVSGRWRRVYCCQISNAGTCFIGRKLDLTSIIVEGVDDAN